MTNFRNFICLLALATSSFGFPAQGNQHAVQIWTAGFGPTKDVRVKNPRFVWQVWADGDAKITSGIMVINGKKVNASYDAKKKELFFEASEPLAPGTYEVLAKVKVDNWANFDKKWTVTIRSDAVQNDAATSTDARQAIEEFNRIRQDHGFEPYRFDANLYAASEAHTKYMAINKEGGHSEDPGKPGFTGSEPSDRVNLFGHVGSSFEVVSMGSRSPAEGIQGLWDAPYHRIHMMQPGAGIAGASFKDIYFTMDGEGTATNGEFVSPPDGGRNVSPAWRNQEIPDPTRNFDDAPTTLGYPIVMNVYGDGLDRISILDSKFSTATGSDVSRYELSSNNDEHLSNSVILIPKKPLASNTTYVVSLKVRDNKGGIHNKTWKFTTR